MHSEHEDAMRSEFHDCITLSWTAIQPGLADAEAADINRRVGEYDQRWQSGPHAQEWNFLCAAYTDWRDHPEDMHTFVEDLRTNPTVYADFGPSEVQLRSLDQAHNIAREERCAMGALKPSMQREPIRRDR
ncbi:hypothetical protein [Nocardia tengchongensis]|uniref:hypothetical protein n=1 Tax=Nocardia tengchongensis TaxID=2055889 RepID=UPI00369D25D4